MGNALSTVDFASSVGTDRRLDSDGGSSWLMSFLARVNQIAFKFCCKAAQTSINKGLGGRLMSVMSSGSDVIATIRLLKAYSNTMHSSSRWGLVDRDGQNVRPQSLRLQTRSP